ncbi:lytic transglycosylase domain-containing protein [Geobacter sp. SVR]|uniref:lytic transglycosylase domain-containing protein n=1 Tax=Geobacter sp. SVR TaxID=2495594 RepID=UPI00143EFE3E|nr:lytic transglycosylase domain-containing protein [Geobacter sp. SVR]GCF86475.1 hypothetical protein GSbR_30750 [Geobacter sp. SVR]
MIKERALLFLLPVLLLPSTARAFCFDAAGREYGINPQLLQSIAQVESNLNPAAINRNKNGSADYGLMQINSFWLKTLGTTTGELLGNPCYNVMAGAFVLRGCLDRHGENWQAIGCYNAASRHKQAAYSWKIYRQLLKGSTAKAPPAGTIEPPGKDRPRPPVSSLWVSVIDTDPK